MCKFFVQKLANSCVFDKKAVLLWPEMNKIVKDSAKLLSANVVAQVIGLLVYPVLTRLYSPDDFGLLNLFLSIGGVLILFATSEYHYAIVLPQKDSDGRAVFHVGLIILSIVTLITLLSVPFASHIAALFKAPSLAKWYWVMPIYVCLLGFWALLNYSYTRKKQYNYIGTYQVSQPLVNAASKVGFGYAGFLSGGMIVSSVIGPFVAIVSSLCLSWRKGIASYFTPSTRAERKAVAREYAKFPAFSLPKSLVNVLSSNLPAFLLTPFFGLTELGFFAMAITLAYRPINMICGSFYQVLYQRVADLVNRRQPIKSLLGGYIWKTLLVTIPCFVALYFVLPWLTQFLLGNGWDTTATIIQLMLAWLAMVLVTTTVNFIPDVFGKQHGLLAFEIGYLIARVVGLYIGIIQHSFLLAIQLYVAAGVLFMILELMWFLVLVFRYEKQLR